MKSTQLFSRLLSYALRYWGGFAVAIIAMVVTAATETAFPAMMKPLMDQGFQGTTFFQIWWVPTVVLLIFISRGIASFVASYSMQWIANNVLRDLREQMFEKLISLPAITFDAKSSGQLIAKIISEAQMVLVAVTNVLTVLVRDTLVLIGLLVWLFWINWKLTLVVIVLMPMLAIMTLIFAKRMRRVSQSQISATAQMTSTVEEVITGNRVIKIFDGKGYEKKRFDKVNTNYRGQAMRIAVAYGLQSPFSQFIAAIGVSVVLTIALIQSRSGGATVGDFVSFITAMLMMFSPLRHLADVNAQLQGGLAAAEGVFAMLDEESERDYGTRKLEKIKGNISFKQVSLQYVTRDKPAVHDISIEITAGQTYAFVGPSGSGKSSLVNLLARIYEPTGGVIEIDGVNIQEVTLSSLRQQIAIVSQEVVLFNDTIANNITYGREDVSRVEIQAAADAADLMKFILTLPAGLETRVGDRGVRVSGGQRQRIAIARAIIKNAPILVLDEATSALDNASETNVKVAIDGLRKNRTTLIVAHRLTSIENADRIIVMDQGRIVQEGTHKELVSLQGLYQRLYEKNPKTENI